MVRVAPGCGADPDVAALPRFGRCAAGGAPRVAPVPFDQCAGVGQERRLATGEERGDITKLGKLAAGKSKVLSEKVLTAPVDAVVKVGTKAAPSAGNTSGAGLNLANAAMWDRIAQCESGGNWHINTGNGYYGGLQFSAATWHSVGGPGLPHQYSREVQIKYAKILQKRSGWGQWSCAGARH